MEGRTVSARQLAFYRRNIHQAVRGDGVVCLECGALYWRLGKHVGVHGLRAAAYRRKWRYPPEVRLALRLPADARRRPIVRRPPARSVSPQEIEGYGDDIREAIWANGIVCLECGGVYDLLGSHVRVHEITLAEYREKWGYNRGTGMVSGSLSERRRQIALERNFGAMSPPGSIEKANAAQAESPVPPARTEQRLNARDEIMARAAAGRAPRRPMRLTDEGLRALVAEGLTPRQIAGRMGLHPSYVGVRARALGLRGPGLRPPRLPVPAEVLLALRREGLGNLEVAGRTGLTVPGVAARFQKLRRQGVAVPPLVGAQVLAQRRLPDAQLLVYVQEGLGRAEIGARVGLAEGTVSQRIRSLRQRGLLPLSKPKADDETLRGLVAEGLTRRQIAARVGLASSGSLGRRLRAMGLTRGIPRERPSPSVPDERLLALRREGLWAREIAERVGLAAATVGKRLRALRRRGAEVPRPAKPAQNPSRRVTDEQLLPLAQAGEPTALMAARLGITPAAVQARLRRYRRRGVLPPAPRRDPPIAALRRKITDEQLLALRAQGLWGSQIAARVGLTRGAINFRLRALQRRGVEVPPPAGRRPAARSRISDQQLVALAQEGLRPAGIAARVGLSLRGLMKRLYALRRRGVLPPPAPKAVPEETLQALVAEGLTVRQIAARGEAPLQRVHQQMRALGLRTRAQEARERAIPDADLLALRATGLWSSQIAARIGMTPGGVAQRLRRLQDRGVPVPPPQGFRPNRLRRVNYDQLLTLARQGFGTAAIARRMGVPIARVYDGIEGLRRRGLLPPSAYPHNHRVAGESLRACVQEGLTIGEIAGRVGLHPSNVAKRLRRLGLKARRGGPPPRADAEPPNGYRAP